MSKQKNKLTPTQREEIIKLRLEDGLPLKTIAEKFGITTQNISYYIRKHKDKLQTEKKKAEKTPPAYELDPIKFRIQKLQEVALDILVAREERVIHSLPTFHKLHISIHNELREFVASNKDIQSLDSETLKREIVETISNLPPLLKTQIIRELEESQAPNVIRLQTK